MITASNSVTKCEWCLTLNQKDAFRCIVCETPLDLPVLSGSRGKELESVLSRAVTGGGARLVANLYFSREIDWTNSRLARKCIQLALAEEFAFFDYLCNVTENGEVYLGWKWPKAKFVNAVGVLIIKNGKLIGRHIEKRDEKNGMAAVNLRTEKGSAAAGIEFAISLRCYIEANMVPMYARKISYFTESKNS